MSTVHTFKRGQAQEVLCGVTPSWLPGTFLSFSTAGPIFWEATQSMQVGTPTTASSTQLLKSWGHTRWQEGEEGSHIMLEKRVLWLRFCSIVEKNKLENSWSAMGLGPNPTTVA